MMHIVSYSGGLASFFEAKLCVEKYGRENTVLVFCDTKTEDEDLYRFLKDTTNYLGLDLITLTEGRDIWEVAYDRKFLFNSRVADCTIKLKIELFHEYIGQFDPTNITVHIGFDYMEQHRMDKAIPHYNPVKVESLIMRTCMTKDSMRYELEKLCITLPRLYRLGFAHNNCGGFCFKAGIGHFKLLLEKLPDRFDYHMEKERELIELIGKPYAILKRKGTPYTLYQFKEDLTRNGTQLSLDAELDIGGCSCFTDY